MILILTDFAPKKKNGKGLGLVDISEVIIDDHSQTSGIPKGSLMHVPPPEDRSHICSVFVTPTRCASFCASLHARVLSIHLAYNWKPLEQWSSGTSVRSSCERVTC